MYAYETAYMYELFEYEGWSQINTSTKLIMYHITIIHILCMYVHIVSCDFRTVLYQYRAPTPDLLILMILYIVIHVCKPSSLETPTIVCIYSCIITG